MIEPAILAESGSQSMFWDGYIKHTGLAVAKELAIVYTASSSRQIESPSPETPYHPLPAWGSLFYIPVECIYLRYNEGSTHVSVAA